MLQQAVESTKSAVITAGTTTGLGLSTVLELIPKEIGRLGTAVGVLLSLTLIVIQIRRHLMDSKRHKLELELLQHKLDQCKDDGKC